MTTVASLAITVRSLLTNIIDYAGLFPPAGLSMSQAAANYAEYLGSDSAWMLGRFIVPVTRLDEFEIAVREPLKPAAHPMWRLSALASDNLHADVERLRRFNDDHRPHMVIDAIELKASREEDILRTTSVIPKELLPYFEIPVVNDPTALIESIAQAGARAKVRTGGISREMFPSSHDLVRFIASCASKNVAFKATAGLHHPVRACYRLTYTEDSPTGMMYGFLNLFLAAAFIRNRMSADVALDLLEEQSPEFFHFSENEIEWRGHKISNDDILAMRKFAVSFGSCSFREPVDDLHSLRFL